MKKITSIILLLMVFNLGYGQTTLTKGDIAIIGVNTDGEDFTFVLRTDITAGTTIYFSDELVNAGGTGLVGITEGVELFTAASSYGCGTVLGYVNNSSEFTTINPGFTLANDGDQVLAFQGYNVSTYEWTTFLHANVNPSINLPIGFTSADIVESNRDNNEFNASISAPTWAELNDTSNYNQENNYAGVTLDTSFLACPCSSTTVTWNGTSWDGTRNTSNKIIINGDYNTSINGGSFSACGLTVNSGFTLTVADGDYIEVENDVIINGDLLVESEANFIQNSDVGFFNDNSTNGAQVTKTKTHQRKFAYTYWSSPVVGETIEDAFSTVQADRRFSFNASEFIDLMAEVNNTGAFNPGQDDIDDDGSDWEIASGTMQAGVGYAAVASQFGPAFPRSEDFVFRGAFNNGVITVPLVNNSGGVYNDWNFLGNPYPCAIDVDDFFTVNSGLVDVIYLWDQATAESETASGSQGQNLSADDYAIINGAMEIGARSGTGTTPNRFISSGQGFFVEALSAGSVTFNNSMRSTSNDNSQFFKGVKSKSKSTSATNKLWLNLTSDNGVFSQIGIAYLDGASKNNDGSFYDTKRPLSSGKSNSVFYSLINSDNGKFAIQGKSPSDINENETIQLGFKTVIEVATLYTISVPQLQGGFMTNNNIYIKDNLLNKVHNLSNSDYTFTSEVGEFNDRFVIAFNTNTLSANGAKLGEDSLKVVDLGGDNVQFTASNNLKIKTIGIYDLLGRNLYNLTGDSSSETFKLSKLNSATFIAKVTLSNGTIITKKVSKN